MPFSYYAATGAIAVIDSFPTITAFASAGVAATKSSSTAGTAITGSATGTTALNKAATRFLGRILADLPARAGLDFAVASQEGVTIAVSAAGLEGS